MPAPALAASLILSAAGPVLLRAGWQRNRTLVAGGWGLLLLAASLAVTHAGAWGLALGTVTASIVAMALIGYAAATTPAPRKAQRSREARASLAPLPLDWRDLGRRVAIFAIALVLDLVAAISAAWAIQHMLFAMGWEPANSLTFGLFAFPLLWLALLSWQMTRNSVVDMALAAILIALPGALTWLTL